MAKIEIELSEAAMKKLERLAQERNEPVDAVLSELIDRAAPAPAVPDGLWGLFREEADLIDDIVDEAMEARRERNARYVNG